MNQVLILQSELLKALGMSMIHSLWQGVVVVVPVLILLGLIPKEKAVWRYRVLYGGLMVMLFLFVGTFLTICLRPAAGSAGAAVELMRPSVMPAPGNYPVPAGTETLTGRMATQVLAFFARIASLLALVWIVGFMVTGTRLVTGLYASRAFVRRGTSEPGHRLSETFEKVRRLLDVTVKVRLRMSAKRISPMVTGFLKPVVIIPIAALANLSPAQVEAIIAHELAHIKRYDHLFLLLQEVAKGILFFHPLTWYFSNRINREREHCCDDLVLKTYTDPIDYIKALTMVQEMNLAGIHAANAVTGKPGSLLSRIRRLIRPQVQTSPLPRLITVLVLLLSAGLLLATTLKKQGDPGPSSALSALTGSGVQPDDSSRIEVFVTIDSDEARQDTSVLIVSKRLQLTEGQEGDETSEITVRMSNDSIREITVNGKTVPPGEYYMYADTVKSLRATLIETGSGRQIVLTDSLNGEPGQIRKEIEVIINGVPSTATDKEIDSLIRDIDIHQDKNIEIIIRDVESSNLNGPVMGDLLASLYPNREAFMPYLQQFKILQADSVMYRQQHMQLYNMLQPDTGRNAEYLRQQYLEQLKKAQEEAQLSREQYLEQLKKAQEEAQISQEEMRQIQKEAAERAAEMAREQAERAKELSEQAREMMERAKEEMEASRAEQEAARKEMQEGMERLQEEMRQKQKEMQQLFEEFQQLHGDSLFLFIPAIDDLEVFVPSPGPGKVYPMSPSQTELPAIVFPQDTPVVEPYPFVLPEGRVGEESYADPGKMEELNSTLRDLEK